MTIADVGNLDKALKILYPQDKIKYVGYDGNPLLALMPKGTKFGGKRKDIGIWYGGNHAGSRTFSVAQTNTDPGKFENFVITRRKDYGLAQISNELIEASKVDGGAFVTEATAEIDNTIRAVSRNYAVSMYGNKGGSRGKVGAISGTALTLTLPAQIVNFEKGMVLKQSTTDGTTGAIGAAAGVVVTGVDRRNGILYAAAWTGFSVNDFLFRDGDFGLSIDGLDSWIPTTAPLVGDNFNGVDRSSDTRLYGQFVDGSALTMEEAIQNLDASLTAEGGKPDYLFMNVYDFNTLRKSLGSQVIWDKVKSPDHISVSFDAISLVSMTQSGVKVVPDRNCAPGTGWLLQMNSWMADSLGPGVHILEQMGAKYQWLPTADGIEARIGYYGNMYCYAPGFNGRVKFY